MCIDECERIRRRRSIQIKSARFYWSKNCAEWQLDKRNQEYTHLKKVMYECYDIRNHVWPGHWTNICYARLKNHFTENAQSKKQKAKEERKKKQFARTLQLGNYSSVRFLSNFFCPRDVKCQTNSVPFVEIHDPWFGKWNV